MTNPTIPGASLSPAQDRKPLVSVVLSFRNEEEVIPELIDRLQTMFRPLPVCYELIFVNDASTDGSLRRLLEKRASDRNIKVVSMSRRFGVSECVLAGMEHAKGDSVIMMDADLQDPPEVIPEMITKWQEGADVVYTVRASRAGESAVKMLLTKMAYKIIRCISEIDLPESAGDFKLLSRRAVDALLRMKDEKDLYLRGLVTWVGFRQVPVTYHRQARPKGETHFPIFRSKNPLKTLVSGLTAFSLFPLQMFVLLAVLVCLLGMVCLIVLVVQLFLQVSIPPWWPILVALILLSGIQMIGIGLVGLYLGRTYNQVKSRPNYIVESFVGFDEKNP